MEGEKRSKNREEDAASAGVFSMRLGGELLP
jgi:hypothetical protein